MDNFPYAPILSETTMTVGGAARNSYATAGWMARDEFASRAPEVPGWYVANTPDMNEHQRFVAWRWFYADMMLATRDKPTTKQE